MSTADPDWRRFLDTGDRTARSRLIERYYPLVLRVASKMARRMPSYIESGEVVSWGSSGLIRAVDNFDEHQGASFETFAVASIRGAILDEQRSADFVPRSVRRRSRDIAEATEKLTAKLGRDPSLGEIAKALHCDVGEVRKIIAQIAAMPVSIDAPLREGEADEHAWVERFSDQGIDPASEAVRHTVLESAVGFLRSLSVWEQGVVALVYYQGLTFSEAGAELGMTEMAVSKLHARIVLGLRARLQRTQVEVPA